MNTTIISDLFLLVSSVNDKLSPVLVQASFLLISNSVSKISPSLMKERWEISRVKAWDRCYCLSWMSLISDRNFYHFCHNLLLMASGQCPTRWMDVVDFFDILNPLLYLILSIDPADYLPFLTSALRWHHWRATLAWAFSTKPSFTRSDSPCQHPLLLLQHCVDKKKLLRIEILAC